MNSLQHFYNRLEVDSNLKEQFVKTPMETLESEINNPRNDKKIFLTVIYILGIALGICLVVAAIVVLKNKGSEVDNFFVSIGSAAVGALAGLLAPTPDS